MTTIAIDGPAGSGKSTVARRVAAELGLPYLDTGAMYRAVAVAALRAGVDPADAAAVTPVAAAATIAVEDRVLLDGDDVTEAIRAADATAAVSAVSAHPDVRRDLVARQRRWVADHGGGVVEGRDIGTVVLTDADLKVYLTARPDVRARRRHGEQADAATVEQTAADLARRDEADSTRATDPLRPADDAWQFDTSDLSIDEVVAQIAERVRSDDGADRERPSVVESARTGDILKPADEGFLSGDSRAAVAFYTVCSFLLRQFFRVWFRGTIEGTEHVPKTGAFVLAPVHRSNLDTPIMCFFPRRVRFMGKDSLWKVKAGAWLLSALGGFPVSRNQTDREAMNRTLELVNAGEPVVLFPEGTRKEGPTVQPLFDGAVYVATKAQVPIVPVGIGGTAKAMGRGDRFIKPAKVHLVVGEPVTPPALRASGRVPRKAVQAATDDLRDTLQALYDQATTRAPND